LLDHAITRWEAGVTLQVVEVGEYAAPPFISFFTPTQSVSSSIEEGGVQIGDVLEGLLSLSFRIALTRIFFDVVGREQCHSPLQTARVPKS
jgi:hypothetical protein